MIEELTAEVSAEDLSPLLSLATPVAMDPRLQRIMTERQFGVTQPATASSDADEVPVLALVDDAEAWRGMSEVRPGTEIAASDGMGEGWIVTGRIPAGRIEAVRSAPFVRSLKAAHPLHPTLREGVAETGARPDLLPGGTLSNGGQGVVIGIIDYGCDFAHRNFIRAGGKTRLLSIWHQGGSTSPSSPFGYGREYSPAQIEAVLGQANPYSTLGYGPAPDTPNQKGSHGTHVMDIAAGNGNGSGVPGFAPNADLVFVDVSHSDLPWSGPDVVGTSFGDSTRLLEAVQYIFSKAGDRPCVINISLGTNGGPHDGTTLVEQGIDRLLAARAGRAVTIAASNSFDDGIHAQGVVAAGAAVDLQWRIPLGNSSHREMEIWYEGGDRLDVEVIGPDGRSLGTVSPGNSGSSSAPNGGLLAFVANRLADPNNRDNMIGVYLDKMAPSGTWAVRLLGRTITTGGAFHAWIERDNVAQSSFAPPLVNSSTIGSIACGRLAIAVGSYDAHKAGQPISWFSSAGPTRDMREKPEISAPGHAVVAAHSRTGNGVLPKNGTSMAAPAVAGILSLMLAEARARGTDLPIAETRTILAATARRSPPAGTQWDSRYGAGRIDANGCLAAVIARPAATSGRTAPGKAKPKARAATKAKAKAATKPKPKAGSKKKNQ